MTRALVLALCFVACKHEPEAAPSTSSSPSPGADVVASELMIGTEEGMTREAIVAALALDGYRFEYVAAASLTTHLVKVKTSDGAQLTPATTAEVAKKLEGRAGVRYVELNRVRQPR